MQHTVLRGFGGWTACDGGCMEGGGWLGGGGCGGCKPTIPSPMFLLDPGESSPGAFLLGPPYLKQ